MFRDRAFGWFDLASNLKNLPSLKLTWPLKIDGWKMYSLLKWSLFRGHVSFQGSTSTMLRGNFFEHEKRLKTSRVTNVPRK